MQRSLVSVAAICLRMTLGCSDGHDAEVSSDVPDAASTNLTSSQHATSSDVTHDSSSDIDAATDDESDAPLVLLDSSVLEDAATDPVDAQRVTSDGDTSSDLGDASVCGWTVDELLDRAGLGGTYAFDCGESAFGAGGVAEGIECLMGELEVFPTSEGGDAAALGDASPPTDDGDAAQVGESSHGAASGDGGAQNPTGARFVKSYSPDCLMEAIYLRLSGGEMVLMERNKALWMPERSVRVSGCTSFDPAGACQQATTLYECDDRAGTESDCSRRFE